jgi:hypothetical protein
VNCARPDPWEPRGAIPGATRLRRRACSRTTVRYAGVLASAAKLRPKIIPKTAGDDEPPASDEEPKKKGCRYWPWAELMSRTFELDVSRCPRCEGRLVLVALVKDERSASRFAKSLGEPTEAPARSPPRPPPYFRSPLIRRLIGHDLVA